MMPKQNQCCSCCCCRDHASDALYRVQAGAFRVKSNAEAYLSKLKAAGFDGFITTEAVNDAARQRLPARRIFRLTKSRRVCILIITCNNKI